MPVRSSNSSVLRWPDREAVDRAAREWATRQVVLRPELLRLGYFGSYARGDWGVGSDLDLLAIVSHSAVPFAERGSAWDTSSFPVATDVLVYTAEEWKRMEDEGRRFARVVAREIMWLFQR